MLGRRLAKLRASFLETVHVISSQMSIIAKPLVEYPACPICEDNYSSEMSSIKAPRVCPCGHTLCTSCLQEIVGQYGECPLCCGKFPPDMKVDLLPRNIFIVQLISTTLVPTQSSIVENVNVESMNAQVG
jgi:hypothetical protein